MKNDMWLSVVSLEIELIFNYTRNYTVCCSERPKELSNYSYLQYEWTGKSTQGDIQSACALHDDHFLETTVETTLVNTLGKYFFNNLLHRQEISYRFTSNWDFEGGRE
jgi:hypothetical protein